MEIIERLRYPILVDRYGQRHFGPDIPPSSPPVSAYLIISFLLVGIDCGLLRKTFREQNNDTDTNIRYN